MFAKYVGLRTIKTGIAVWLSISIASLLGLDSPFYAAIAAIIAMEKTTIQSFENGKNRILGTLVGALIGLVCASFMPQNALVCGIGIIILICACNLMKLQKSITVGGVVLIGIMINLDGKTPLYYSINRTIDTLMGICIALIVNHVLFPYDNITRIEYKLNEILQNLMSQIQVYITSAQPIQSGKVYQTLDKLEEELIVYKNHIHLQKKAGIREHLEQKINQIRGIYMHIEMLSQGIGKYNINSHNQEGIHQLGLAIHPTFHDLDKVYLEEHTVYNYHLSKIIADYQTIIQTQTNKEIAT